MQFSYIAMKLKVSFLSFLSTVTFSVADCSTFAAASDGILSVPPRILFLGIGNWQELLAVEPNPLVFLSSLETNFDFQEHSEGRIRFGLHLLDNEVDRIDEMPPEMLNTFVANLKANFESATGNRLQYCATKFSIDEKIKNAFLENGIICLRYWLWQRKLVTKARFKHLAVDFTSRRQLKEFLQSEDGEIPLNKSESDSSSNSD